jgi:chromosome segregation ATPase
MKTEHAADKGKIHACEAVTEQEGWTAEHLMGYLDTKAKDGSFKEQMQAIAFDINASITAERERSKELREDLEHYDEVIDKREKEIQQLREQLAKAQAAMKQLNGCRNRMANAFNAFGSTQHEAHAKEFWNADDDFDKAMSPDTTALDAAIAAAQQPMVDALHKLAMRVLQSALYLHAKQETDDALLLARVKERK